MSVLFCLSTKKNPIFKIRLPEGKKSYLGNLATLHQKIWENCEKLHHQKMISQQFLFSVENEIRRLFPESKNFYSRKFGNTVIENLGLKKIIPYFWLSIRRTSKFLLPKEEKCLCGNLATLRSKPVKKFQGEQNLKIWKIFSFGNITPSNCWS